MLLLQALESKVLLDTAMSLYGLEHSELYWEKAQVPHLPTPLSLPDGAAELSQLFATWHCH